MMDRNFDKQATGTTVILRVFCALLMIGVWAGCSSLSGKSSLAGTWECRDLHSMAQLAQFKTHTLIIRADGTYNEFLTGADGTRGRSDAGRYTMENNRIQFGGYGQWYTFSKSGSTLTLTLEKSSNPDALGKSLKYSRLD